MNSSKMELMVQRGRELLQDGLIEQSHLDAMLAGCKALDLLEELYYAASIEDVYPEAEEFLEGLK